MPILYPTMIQFETLNWNKLKSNILIFDTETADSITSPIPYDFSLIIYDINFNIIYQQCYLISEIWNDFKRYNTSFYGISKRGIYNEMLQKNKAKVISAKSFNKELQQLLKNNNIKIVSAYNLEFDMKAYQKLCIENNLVNHLEKKIKIDIQLITQERLRYNKNFVKWCIKNNAITEKGYCSVKVDLIYKYLFKSKKNEQHIGIFDVKQEAKILQYFIKKNPVLIKNQYQSYNYFLKDLKI